jgi:hypothetical protein
MKSLLLRYRWAVLLAILQTSIFAAVGVSEHRRSLRYNHTHAAFEYFGCFRLTHQIVPPEADWAMLECFPSGDVKFVVLSNFPVIVVWGVVASFTANLIADQFRVFYLVNGVGIPMLWFGIGFLFDRRRFRRDAGRE